MTREREDLDQERERHSDAEREADTALGIARGASKPCPSLAGPVRPSDVLATTDAPDAPSVSVYKSERDGAWVVQIDTTFEPNGSDGGPGLRVYINDDDTYVGVDRRAACDD